MTGLLEEFERCCRDIDVRAASPDDAVDGVMPDVVSYPRGTREVAEIARLASSKCWTLVARGGGTKLDWACPPLSAQVVVDLSRADRILEHSSGDFVARAQAGATLADVNRQLVELDQWLPVEEVVPGSTVGGVIATGLCGPSRYLHGAVRDLLIGVTVVRADGVVARSGSKVVKNVAGYDLSKLFTGSYGTLGIVTEAIFRLRPWPPRRLFVTATYADEAALAPALAGVVRSQAALSAVEVDRPVATGAIGLSVLLEGRPGPVDERARAVSELLGGAEVSDHEPEGFAALPGPVTFKVTTPPGSVAALLVLLRALAGEHQVWPAVRGSAGVGALFVGFAGDEAAGPLAAFLSGVRAGCARRGGSATVLRAPAPVKASLDVWGPVPGLDLMRRVKRQFDPDGRLAPGRFVGGL